MIRNKYVRRKEYDFWYKSYLYSFNLISVVKNPSLHPKYIRHVQNRIHYVIHGNTNRIAQSFGTSCVPGTVCVCMCQYIRICMFVFVYV